MTRKIRFSFRLALETLTRVLPLSILRGFRAWPSRLFRDTRKLVTVLISAIIPGQALQPLGRAHRVARNNALKSMVAGRWGEAHALWRDPISASITGEQQQLWNAGRIITHWILQPETLTESISQRRQAQDTLSEDTVVFSAITSHHDLSWPAGESLPSASHFRFTDDPAIPTWDTWQNRPLEYLADSPVRSARWVKTHPHMLFPDLRWAIWLDGNVIPLHGLQSLLAEFQASGHPMAAIPHPLRTQVEEEIKECIQRGKDDPITLKQHRAMLGEDPIVGLWETNVCFFDLHHPHLKPLLTKWWSLIEAGSHRDQISLPYAVKANGSTIHPLLTSGLSTRSDPRFALIPHKNSAFHTAHTQLQIITPHTRSASVTRKSTLTTVGVTQ